MRALQRAGHHVMDIVLSLELPAKARSGERLRGRLTIENRGRNERRVATPDSAGALNIVVFDHNWNLVAPQAVGKVHVARAEISLATGASTTVEVDGLRHLSSTAAMEYALRPGVYRVLAVFHPGTSRRPVESDYPVVVASNVVEIEVTPE
jgi:hypothetical protein